MISYNANVNSSPSIVTLPNYVYGSTWIEYEQMVYYSRNYLVRYYYGSAVQSCSINRGGGSSNGGFAVWSQSSPSWLNKSIRFDNGSPVSASISTLSTAGKYLQAGNGAGSDLSNMYVSSFYPFSTPYYFATSGTLAPLSKANPELASGRGFEINIGDASFRYNFKDLNIDGRNVEFSDIPDTSNFGNVDILNEALITEPFQINANSKIIFTEQSGYTDSLNNAKNFGKDKYINYKVELIDNATSNVIGKVKNINLTSSNLHTLKTRSYSLIADGLNGRTARLKISLETNFAVTKKNIDDNLMQFLQNDKIPISVRDERKNVRHSNIILIKSLFEKNEVLAKSSLDQITLEDTNIPKNYNLEQNYPNPFNPTTVINYQIPADGFVSLKVYDVLGREVKTLVNEFQKIGKYRATFDASELSSGIYFYTIKTDNFSKTNKMLLLK